MIYDKYSAIARCAFVLIGMLCFSQASLGERFFHVDLGIDSQTTLLPGWNNFQGFPGATPTNTLTLNDSANSVTTVTMTPSWSAVNSDSGVNGTSANYSGPYPSVLAGIPQSALRDGVYVRDGESLTLTLNNLTAGASYSFLFYGGASNTGDYSLFTVTGDGTLQSSISLLVNNNSQVARVGPLLPDPTNKISIKFEGRRPDGSNQNPLVADDGLGRFNFLHIVETTTVYQKGDFNRDGAVNASDYLTWRGNYGAAAALTNTADGNGNGIVDAADYVMWRNSIFAGSGASESTQQSIPEPNGLALLAMSLTVWSNILGWPRRRRNALQK